MCVFPYEAIMLILFSESFFSIYLQVWQNSNPTTIITSRGSSTRNIEIIIQFLCLLTKFLDFLTVDGEYPNKKPLWGGLAKQLKIR